MLGFLTRPRPRTLPSGIRRTRLYVEPLETRDCPSAPSLTLVAEPGTGHNFFLGGQVYDNDPASCTVHFDGAISGTATPNSTGAYGVTLAASYLGTVQGSVVNAQGVWCVNNVLVTLVNNPPTVNSLSITYGTQRAITLSGTVSDEDPAHCTITVSGVASGTAPVAANGSYSVTLIATALGQVTVTASDPWSQASNPVSQTLTSSAPAFTSFGALEGQVHTWTFQGNVSYSQPNPGGLVVTFAGTPSLQGKTATVGSDGNFSLTVIMQSGENGTVTADCSNWWGQAAKTVWTVVYQTY
jgi:hypothetical protein